MINTMTLETADSEVIIYLILDKDPEWKQMEATNKRWGNKAMSQRENKRIN